MHWLRIIRRDDNPEWTAVRHADGAVSEVKVSIEDDRVHVTVARFAHNKNMINFSGQALKNFRTLFVPV